jgi:hypothetical protein
VVVDVERRDLAELVPEQHERGVGELNDLGAPVDVVDPLEVRILGPRVERSRGQDGDEEAVETVDVHDGDDKVVQDQNLKKKTYQYFWMPFKRFPRPQEEHFIIALGVLVNRSPLQVLSGPNVA